MIDDCVVGRYSVGWYDADINDWYFATEYMDWRVAHEHAQRVANNKRTKVRVTDHQTDQIIYFEPTASHM